LTANDGIEALKTIAENAEDIELVITDIRMPRMNGMELLSEIKARYPEIGVMVISAYGEIRTAVDAMRRGAYDYIPKPLPEPLDELDFTISRYFEKHQLEERLRRQELGEMERVRQELADARQIQQSLLPKAPPQIEGFDIAGISVPAKEVSGDFYDYLPVEDGVGIVLGDVSGKSVRAAMVAAMVNGMLQLGLRTQRESWNCPSTILRELNSELRPRLLDWMFTAMSLAILNVDQVRLSLCNAGQCYPIVKRREEAWKIEVSGIPLGCLDDADYTQEIIDLQPRDCVVFYSDGITEATNASGEMYQIDRLLSTIRQADRDLPAQDMIHHILHDVSRFVGDVDQADDMTLVVLISTATPEIGIH
jgi:serine phosphatase RsbU (regulator of sigma subunit)